MINSLPYILTLLVIGIALIVLLTTKFKVPAFFALFTACMVVGFGIGLNPVQVIKVIKEGFGNILNALGLIIVLGSALGLLLEYTGSTTVIAAFLLKRLGNKYAAWAMSITGFVVGLPIFCDSGYMVLSGINNSMARRSGISLATMSVSLATGLMAVHCLIPPHPGATTAATTLGVDFGKLILIGIVIAVPTMIIGNLWAKYAGRNQVVTPPEDAIDIEESGNHPSLIKACLPVFVPIILIGAKPFLTDMPALKTPGGTWLLSPGDPVIALLIGVLLAFNCKRSWTKKELSHVLMEATEKAGAVLMIIGMGGAFGAILTATKIGQHFSQLPALTGMGLLFPFLLCAVLKTAQGSSTVAIITAASLVLPLLPVMGLDSENGRLLCVLAMGAGSMVISHANDAYFWVIAKFSGLDMKTMLKVYSPATLLMGITAFVCVYILSKVM